MSEVCIANIGVRERRKRRNFGVFAFAATTVALAVMVAYGIERSWRLALFFPLVAAASAVIQARDRT
ncbi:MAG: hypothetical protein U0168_02150 [Nannocystaceae bacterium]